MPLVKISEPELGMLDLSDWGDGYVTLGVEVALPTAREVVEDLPGRDGTDDRTRYTGARALTLALDLCERPHLRQALVDRMAPFMEVWRRPALHVATELGAPFRRLNVRPGDASLNWAQRAHLPLSWGFRTVGDPWWYGEDRILDLAARPPAPGRLSPLVTPRTYPDAPEGLVASAFNAGNRMAAWVWSIDGPVTNPSLRNETTGQAVVLALRLQPGQTAVVHGADHKVFVDGQRRHSAIRRGTTWWHLSPGETPVTMPVESASGDVAARLAWSDTYIA